MKTFLNNFILRILTLAICKDISVVATLTTSIFPKPSAEMIRDIQVTIPRAIEEPIVSGAGFSRMFQIWLENTNFEVCASSNRMIGCNGDIRQALTSMQAAASNKDMRWLAGQGVLLENYYAGQILSSRE